MRSKEKTAEEKYVDGRYSNQCWFILINENTFNYYIILNKKLIPPSPSAFQSLSLIYSLALPKTLRCFPNSIICGLHFHFSSILTHPPDTPKTHPLCLLPIRRVSALFVSFMSISNWVSNYPSNQKEEGLQISRIFGLGDLW